MRYLNSRSEHGVTRREFMLGATAMLVNPIRPSVVGCASHGKYRLAPGWGDTLPNATLGWGCGVVVDSSDRVYVHTRCREAVTAFDRHGFFLNSWGAEFASTGHGFALSREGHEEFLYFADPVRNQVVKTSLAGSALLRIGAVDEMHRGGVRFALNQPTGVAIGPEGDVYVCEGYGGQRIHRFTSTGRHLQTAGGPGSESGKFDVCHSIWVDVRKREPELYVADRGNSRVQVLDLDLKFKRSLDGDFGSPTGLYARNGKLYVADLEGRVTILDETDRAIATLGGRSSTETGYGPPMFAAPHAVAVDSHGDLYVVEWVERAPLRKFSLETS